MGFLSGFKQSMTAANAAEVAYPLIPNEVNKIIGEIGWILQNGRETNLHDDPQPNLPANAQNAVKWYQYNYLNFQQMPVKLDMYLVYMSMTATDCVFFTYVNGATAATLRFPDYVQLPPGGSAMLVNRERLANEVRGFLQPFGSLIPPPPVQQQVIVAQPQPTMVVMAPAQPTMVVTAPAQPQVERAQPPPPMAVQQNTPAFVMCPRCGMQIPVPGAQGTQVMTQTTYTQTQSGYGQPVQPAPQPQPQPQPQGQPQNVNIMMPGMTMQTTTTYSGTGCPRCGGAIDPYSNTCTVCGLRF